MKLLCQKCNTEIFVNENMIMIHDDIWNTYFNKSDIYCDHCIESILGRNITVLDLTDVPCNYFWKEKHNL